MSQDFPFWVLLHKGKGKEIRLIKGNYYLYQVKCVWNKARKRPQKLTEAFLGRITPTGLAKGERQQKGKTKLSVDNIGVKEYGIASFLLAENKDVLLTLKTHFTAFETIFCAAFYRFVHHSPLKNMEHYHHVSYLSDLLPNATMNDKALSLLLLQIGGNRPAIAAFMQEFMQQSIIDPSFLLLDATQVLSLSGTVEAAQVGYNAQGSHDPQVSLLYLFDADAQMPAFYRIVPGNIKEVTAMEITIKESKVQNVVIVADKGFYSAKNITFLVDKGLQYIIPLRRSSNLINYQACEVEQRKGFTNYIRFNDRIIWYIEAKIDEKQRLILYLDEDLKRAEQHDYLQRIEKEHANYSLEGYHLKATMQGTIALLTNVSHDKSPQQIYQHYKNRAAIEILFDTFKNVLFADVTYTRSNEAMEAWLFINHLALIFYYRLYKRLVQYDLLKKYSPKDVVMHLNTIKKVKINDQWIIAEIPAKSKIILQKLNIPIT